MDPSQLQAYLMQLNSQTPPGSLGDAFLGGTVPNPLSAAAADNSAALSNFFSTQANVMDGGGLTYKFTNGITLTGVTGRVGVRNCVLDFSAATAATKAISLTGPGLIGSAVALSADASYGDGSISVSDVTSFLTMPYMQELIVSSTTAYNPQQLFGEITSERTWLVSAEVTSSPAGTITLFSTLETSHTVAASATVQAISTAFQPYFDNVTIIGSGAAAAGSQTGLDIHYATRGWFDRLNIEDFYSFGLNLLDSSLCQGGCLSFRGLNNTVGEGFGLDVAGGFGHHFNSVIGRKLREVVANGASNGNIIRHASYGTVKGYGIWGDGIFNVHPGAAYISAGLVEGDTYISTLATDGYGVIINGFNCTVGVVNVKNSTGHVVLLQDFGSRDLGVRPYYYIGAISGRSLSSSPEEFSLLIEPSILDGGTTAGADYFIGSVDSYSPRGIGVIATGGHIGTVYIGASEIQASASDDYGVNVKNVSPYKITRVIFDNLSVSSPYTAVMRIQGDAGVTLPVVILNNPVLNGGTNSLVVTNGVACITNPSYVGNSGAALSVDTGSVVMQDGTVTVSASLASSNTVDLPSSSAVAPKPINYRLTLTSLTNHLVTLNNGLLNQHIFIGGAGAVVENGTGNIHTSTGANVTISSDQILHLICDGTGWYGVV